MDDSSWPGSNTNGIGVVSRRLGHRFLRPPVVQEAEGARMRIVTDFDPEDIHDLEDTHDH